MVDIDKFIISMINSQKRSGYKPDFHWLGMAMIEALKDQGFEYKDGAIVTTSPNLAESEDERIRKELLYFCKNRAEIFPNDPKYKNISAWIAWLEKQGEQKFFINDKVVHKATGKIWTIHHYLKDTNSYYVEDNDGLLHHYRESELKLVEQKPAEWSKEDEIRLKHILRLLDVKDDKKYLFMFGLNSLQDLEEDIAWLKSLKDKVGREVNCTTTKEWSEEDKNHVKSILSTIECCKAEFPNAQAVVEAYNADIEWLKSLKPQSQWKPSVKQLEALKNAIHIKPFENPSDSILWRLYEQLKKLREE